MNTNETMEWEKRAAKLALAAHKKTAHYGEFSELIYQGIKSELALREQEIVGAINMLGNEQVMLYGGKLPFVVFQGKADENEKVTIYRQALKDVLTTITKKD